VYGIHFRARVGAPEQHIIRACAGLLLALLCIATSALAQDGGGSSPAGGPQSSAGADSAGSEGDGAETIDVDTGDGLSEEGQAPASRESAQLLEGSANALQAYHQLAPNDYIRIVVNAGGLTSFDRTVDANGDITLPLVADGAKNPDGSYRGSPPLHVEGQTVSGVQMQLQQAYSVYYIAPSVDVALVAVGRAPIMIVYPTGRTATRNIVNGQTLFDVLGGGLQYRTAYVVRGGYDLLRRVTRQQPAPVAEVPALPPAEAVANGIVQSDTGMSTREELRLESLITTPGVQVFTVDIAQLLRAGRLDTQNVELRAGDIVFLRYGPLETVIGRGPKLVSIIGVPQSGTYGLLPGETLADLLRMSGFMEAPSLDLRNVLIERYDADGELRRIVANIDPASSSLDLSTVQLEHRDIVRIQPYVNQVFVVGSVHAGGGFGYNAKYKALDYLALAGGPNTDAHLKFVKLIHQDRTVGTERRQPEVLTINLAQDMKGLPQENYEIRPGDILYFPPKGFEPTIRDVTAALSSVFLGINYFDNSSSASSTGGS
jgi:hypothetical protein